MIWNIISANKKPLSSTFEYCEKVRITSYILLLAIILQSLFRIVVCLNYEINKEYITLNYCENKDKPKLKCKGKCHLKKQLKELDKQESSDKNTTKAEREMQLFTVVPNVFSNPPGLKLSDLDSDYLMLKTDIILPTSFRPPSSLSFLYV